MRSVGRCTLWAMVECSMEWGREGDKGKRGEKGEMEKREPEIREEYIQSGEVVEKM